MAMSDFLFCYITCENSSEAKMIAKDLVGSRIAACANIIPGMESVYWWNDEINEGTETILVLKIRATDFGVLEKRVLELHSYDCPCIVALPIEQAGADYTKWLIKETDR